MSVNTKKVSQCGAAKFPNIFKRKGKGKQATKKGKKQSPERPQSFTKFLVESRDGQKLLAELIRAEQMEPEKFGRFETFGIEQSKESPKSMKRARVSSSPNGPNKKGKVAEPGRKPKLPEKPQLTKSKREKLGPKKRMTSANTVRIAGELREALAKFYEEQGKKSPGNRNSKEIMADYYARQGKKSPSSRSSVNSSNSSLWNASSVGSSLSSSNSLRRRTSSPKAKKI